MLFEPITQTRVSHAMFKVTSFVDFRPYLKSFDCLEDYIYQLSGQLTDVVTNPGHKYMEDGLSKLTDIVLL